MTQFNKLNPYYIAGLIQAKGEFIISNRRKGKNIWLSPKLNITLEKKHKKIIESLISYFNTGYYKIDNKGNCKLTISNINDIINKIIPFFLQYQIYDNKFKNFIIFKIICEKIINKEHYISSNNNNKTLYYLLNSAYNMNNKKNKKELLRYLNEEKRNIVLNKELYYQNLIDSNINQYQNFQLNIDFIKGLFDGNGNIILYLTNKSQIRLNFNIITEMNLLELILKYFDNKGNIYKGKYEIKSIINIYNHILPKFNNFENGIDYNIKLYKLKLIKELIDWMFKNNINKINNSDQLMKYINYNYKIFKNPRNLTFEQYKNQIFELFDFTNWFF